MAHPTAADVRAFVYAWYRLLDSHVDVGRYLPLLSGADAVMVFPEARLEGVDAFSAWYRGGNSRFPDLPGVINLFFDEVHELKRVDVVLANTGDWRADVLVVVKWEAHRWKPPNPKSEYLGFDAWQRWALKLSPAGQPVIQEYTVDALEKLQGSADL